jgi:hypothetical protein
MPPKRVAPPTPEEIATKKQKKADYDRERQARLSEAKKEEQRERKRELRSQQDEVERQQQRDADVLRHQELRAQQNEVERQQRREIQSQQQRDSRSQLSVEQLNLRSQEQREYRVQLPDEERQRQREQNTEQHQITYQINAQARVGPHASRFNRNVRTRNIALQIENFNENAIEENYLGQLNVRCPYCSSKNFKNELKSNCCHGGTILLNTIEMHPDIVFYMTNADDANSKNFRSNIRSYNSAMAFASMGAQVDEKVTRRAGPFCYRIHGQIYHKTSGLHPNEGETAKYSQLYILDTTEATNARMNNPANNNCIIMWFY